MFSETMPTPLQVALKGLCPRCGKGKLFSTFLKIGDKCTECNLSYKTQDAGDGPVFFVLILVGFLSVGISGYIELKYQPEWWVHIATFVPITCSLVVLTTRFFKAWLIALQFRHRPDTFTE